MSFLTFDVNANNARYQFDLNQCQDEYRIKVNKFEGHQFAKLCSDSLKNVAAREEKKNPIREFQRLFVKIAKDPELGDIKIESRIYTESLKWFLRLQGRITQCYENGEDLYVEIPTLDPQSIEKCEPKVTMGDLSSLLMQYNTLLFQNPYGNVKK